MLLFEAVVGFVPVTEQAVAAEVAVEEVVVGAVAGESAVAAAAATG